MLCTVTDIRGDYATVQYDATGVESEVAIALLPFGIEVGDRLLFEDYEFTKVKKISPLGGEIFYIISFYRSAVPFVSSFCLGALASGGIVFQADALSAFRGPPHEVKDDNW